MTFSKTLLRQAWFRAVLCRLIAWYIRFTFHSTRWSYANKEVIDRAFTEKKPVIFAFWHGQLLLMPLFDPTPWRTHVISSRHRDGALIARVIRRLGLRVIHGSSNRAARDPKGAKNRGGTEALRQAVKVLKAGDNVALTPDGPHGPARKVQGTIIEIARLSGAPILPIAYATSWGRQLDTWDRFWLPYPFGTGLMICGELLEVPAEASEITRQKSGKTLENRLNAITLEAQQLKGND